LDEIVDKRYKDSIKV